MTPTAASFVATVAGDGTHVLRLKGVDAAGNVFINTSAWQWLLDTTPPTSSVRPKEEISTFASQAVFNLTCTAVTSAGIADCVGYEWVLYRSSPATNGCGNATAVQSGFVNAGSQLVVMGLSSGEHTVHVTAVDAVGLRQVTPAEYKWQVRLAGDLLQVNITAGPPPVFAYKQATWHLFAHRPGSTAAAPAKFEMKLGESPWTSGAVLCPTGGVRKQCSLTLDRGVGVHTLQVRAIDLVTTLPGASAIWRWEVRECSIVQYANVSADGSLTCEGCPPGGNCSDAGSTAHSVVALPGWWSPAQGKRLSFYRCPFQGACLGGNITGNTSVASRCNQDAGFSDSTLCATCRPAFVREGDACVECPSTGMSVGLTVLSFLGVVVFVCIKQEMVQKESEPVVGEVDASVIMSARRSSVQRILLSYISVLASVGDFKARGPAFLRDLTGWASSASGGVSMGLYFVKCALGWDFYARLWGGIFFPLLLVLCCALYVCIRGVCKGSQRSSPSFLVGCSVMVVFLAYSAQTKDLLMGTHLTIIIHKIYIYF
jgi:hypothetical protein